MIHQRLQTKIQPKATEAIQRFRPKVEEECENELLGPLGLTAPESPKRSRLPVRILKEDKRATTNV